MKRSRDRGTDDVNSEGLVGLLEDVVPLLIDRKGVFVETTSMRFGHGLAAVLRSRHVDAVLLAPTTTAAVFCQAETIAKFMASSTAVFLQVVIVSSFHSLNLDAFSELDNFLRGRFQRSRPFGGLTCCFIGLSGNSPNLFTPEFDTLISNNFYGISHNDNDPHANDTAASLGIEATLINDADDDGNQRKLRELEHRGARCLTMGYGDTQLAESAFTADIQNVFSCQTLFVGTQVVLVEDMTEFERAGSRGIIIDFAQHSSPRIMESRDTQNSWWFSSGDHPIVRFIGGRVLEIPFWKYERAEHSAWCIPLMPAWSLPSSFPLTINYSTAPPPDPPWPIRLAKLYSAFLNQKKNAGSEAKVQRAAPIDKRECPRQESGAELSLDEFEAIIKSN